MGQIHLCVIIDRSLGFQTLFALPPHGGERIGSLADANFLARGDNETF